ncbi:MAG: 5'-nucleotidase C-terminal domain-containing protein, partial [Duncaniella sp.]|nr:5'-nucleotidase C-terminal domain-containing protein [Duncaniella sp.]
TKGVYVGEIDINLADKTVNAHLIPVDSRLDNRLDPKFTSLIDPYTHKVDSVKAIVVGKTSYDWERESPELLNLMSDFVRERGEAISGKPVDLSIMNKGGIRNSLSAGDITKGAIIDIAPFNNRIVVLELSGSDLIENLAIMAAQEGNGVSSNVKVLYDPASKQLNSATIDGKPIKPDSKYRVATIDYLAAGNDYMTPLSRGVTLAKSKIILYDELIQGIESGKMDHLLSSPDKKNRMASF